MKRLRSFFLGCLIAAVILGSIYALVSTYQPNLLAAFKASPPLIKSGIGLFVVLLTVVLVRDKVE